MRSHQLKRIDYRDNLYTLPAKLKPESFWQTFKRQATEDKITTVLIIICTMLGMAVVVAQLGIRFGW